MELNNSSTSDTLQPKPFNNSINTNQTEQNTSQTRDPREVSGRLSLSSIWSKVLNTLRLSNSAVSTHQSSGGSNNNIKPPFTRAQLVKWANDLDVSTDEPTDDELWKSIIDKFVTNTLAKAVQATPASDGSAVIPDEIQGTKDSGEIPSDIQVSKGSPESPAEVQDFRETAMDNLAQIQDLRNAGTSKPQMQNDQMNKGNPSETSESTKKRKATSKPKKQTKTMKRSLEHERTEPRMITRSQARAQQK